MRCLHYILSISWFLFFSLNSNIAQTADLELHLKSNSTTHTSNTNLEFILELVHSGGVTTNAEVLFHLPDSTSLLSIGSNNGSYIPHIATWRIYDLAANDTAYIKIKAHNFNESGIINAFAQVLRSDVIDPDSSPNNNTTNRPIEDDEASVRIFPANHAGITMLNFSKFPEEEQLFPRNLQTNLGTIEINGTATQGQNYKELLVKLYRADELQQSFLNTLQYEENSASFQFDIPILAELKNYSIELYGVTESGEEALEASANKLVSGDVYIINGQSNAQAHVAPFFSDNHPFARGYEPDVGWTNMQYSTPGQWGARMAINIIEEQEIPVAIFNQAIGGQRIAFYLRNEDNQREGNYGDLLKRLEAAGIKEEVRAGFWFQGESDGWIADENFTETYKNQFKKIHTAWQEDYKIEQSYVFQVRYQSCLHLHPYVMEAQRQLQHDFANISTMSTTNTAHDSCHYYYENGYEVLGDRLYKLMASELYNATDYNVAAPDIRRAYLSGAQELTLELRDVQGELNVIGDPWSEFRVEGSAVNVVSGRTEGERIILQLSGPPVATTGISYLSHIGTAPNWVTNDQEVGLLTFYNYPIEALPESSTDLEVRIAASKETYERFKIMEYEVTLSNSADIDATNIELEVPVPSGTAFSEATISDGQYLSWEKKWLVPQLAAGTSATLQIKVFPLVGDDIIVAYAQVTDVDQSDPDSMPDNGAQSFPREDDEARLLFMPEQEQLEEQGELDIALMLESDTEIYRIYTNVDYHLIVENRGQSTATNINIDLSLSEEFAYTMHEVSHGNYDNWNSMWHIRELKSGEIAELDLTMFTLTNTKPLVVSAELLSLDQMDVNASNDSGEWIIRPSGDPQTTSLWTSTDTRIIKAYPIPVQDMLRLKTFSKSEQATKVYINDAQGRTLKEYHYTLVEGYNTVSVDCSHLARGIYFLVLRSTQGEDLLYKVVKE